MLDHQDLIILPATAARRQASVSTVILHSLGYDAVDVMYDVNLATALSAQIQIHMALNGTVRKLSVNPIVLAKQWGITLEKA